jgi:riboflavin kinase/FMN adenylyltransferase
MRRHFRLQGLPGPSALAIGNFDGFHAGHRRVLRLLAAQARRRRLQAAVLTFHPHPRVFLGQEVRLIQTDAQRLETLSRQELDHLLFVDFAAVAGMPAADFVAEVLLARLRARLLVVGSDFRFGRGREGDLAFLRRAVAGRCAVVAAPDAVIDGRRVASSLVRRLLDRGLVREAGRLLGRPYCIDGVVVHGAGRGRELGFPTMNIDSANDILPSGVFRTELELRSLPGRRLPSATFIGRAPAFTDPARPLRVETHVPGFCGSVYGRRVRLHFLARIRGERRFAAPAELVAQIRRDLAALGD